MTAKHNDGFAMWPSKYAPNWNSMDVGPHRDLVGELADAIRENTNLAFGIYYWLTEVFNPLYLFDKKSDFNTTKFVDLKIMPQLKELVENYAPEVLSVNWLINNWPTPTAYWKAPTFLAWLYNESPVRDTVVVNDRWGWQSAKFHGDFYLGYHSSHPWYTGFRLDTLSEGYRRNAKINEFRTPQDMIGIIAEVVSGGGNIFFDIGPTKEGTIPLIVQKRLTQVGTWLKRNGEAIYETKKWKEEKDVNEYTYYTSKGRVVYAINTRWPEGNKLSLKHVKDLFLTSTTKATILGGNGKFLEWKINGDFVNISFPSKTSVKSDWAYVVKIET